MSDYVPLSDEQKSQIVNEHLKPILENTTPAENPRIMLVGGQPGAGKSQASELAKAELDQNGGYVHVDADIMRAKIPAPPGVIYSSEQTQSDAGALAIRVRNEAKAQRRNVVEEGTFRNDLSIFIDSQNAQGYGVEMLALAAAPEESLVGIFNRYEDQHAACNPQPRFVPEGYHLETIEGFKNTLEKNEGQLERVRVTNRSGNILYDSQTPERNQHATAKEALAAYQEMTPERLKQVAEAWDRVQAMADRRTQDPVEGYFEKVKQHREDISRRLEQVYQQERVVVNSTSASLQRKTGDTWQEVEKVSVQGMKAGVHMLVNAKKAEAGKSYQGEIVHKDAASVFQKTPQGLVRHRAYQLSGQVTLGQKCAIRHEAGKNPEVSRESTKQAVKRRM